MSYLDHIIACNRHDSARFRPFRVVGQRVGWVRHDVAEQLKAFPKVFSVAEDAVALSPDLATPEQRAAAVDEACRDLHARGQAPRLRGERYTVSTRWGGPELMTIDRGVVSLFGIAAYGVHVNGCVGGDHLWIGKRAANKAVAPGKLDNMIAGGQPAGLSLMDNLVKEAAEEADVPEALARTARPAGAISYCHEGKWGLKPDTMFCFDLDLPPDFTPRNTDGEMESFRLIPVAEAATLVRDANQFKFNVNLVILDFLIRRGFLNPDAEPDYLEIVRGLRR